jgi:hypothetical protein
MSQMTATARPLRAPRRVPVVTPLRVIPSRIGTSGNGAFATLCVTLLTLGLIGLLLLNTALAEGSLTLGALRKQSGILTDRAGDLGEEIARASSSNSLAARATALGMVRKAERGYVDVTTGKVSGTAQPATKLQKVPIVVAPMPTPRAVKRITSAVDGATAAAAAAATAAAKEAANLAAAATPKATDSAAPPSATETLDSTSKPAGTPATTR